MKKLIDLLSIPTVWIDGFLYCSIAVLGALQSISGTDEAAKYLDPSLLFYVRSVATLTLAGAGALKMYRSTSFADHLASQKAPETATAAQPLPQPGRS